MLHVVFVHKTRTDSPSPGRSSCEHLDQGNHHPVARSSQSTMRCLFFPVEIDSFPTSDLKILKLRHETSKNFDSCLALPPIESGADVRIALFLFELYLLPEAIRECSDL